MGKVQIDLPEEIHNKIRHKSIDTRKEIREIIIDILKKELIKKEKK